MENVVKRILRKHKRQIAHLNDKYAFIVENFCRVCNELVRIFKVVEHRDRGYHFYFLTSEFIFPEFRIKKLGDNAVCAYSIVFCKIFRWFKAREADAGRMVPAQKRAVVRRDIKHKIPLSEIQEGLCLPRNAVKLSGHARIHSGAIPIISIERFGRYRMFQLKQTASATALVAKDQGKRIRAGEMFLPGSKEVGRTEIAERKNGGKLIVAAHPAHRPFFYLARPRHCNKDF